MKLFSVFLLAYVVIARRPHNDLLQNPDESTAIQCNGFLGTECPEGFQCVDVPDDGCDPDNGGTDCIGRCFALAIQPVPSGDQCFRECPPAFAPVCGSNNQTYINPCELEVENCYRQVGNLATLTSTPGACLIPGDFEFPGLGPDSQPQETESCADSCGGVSNNGACWCDSECDLFGDCCADFSSACPSQPPVDACDVVCSALYAPVCGSDGVTYSNECNFNVANCKQAGVLSIASTGECPTQTQAADAADTSASPQRLECSLPQVVGPCKALFRRWFYNTTSGECEEFIYGGCMGNGNNFMTEAECEPACERPATGQTTPDEPQETEEACPQFCPAIFNPVCGSDGVTYSNPCFFGIENCNRQRDNLVALTSTPGACAETGSCAGSCGDVSNNGECWCDTDCTEFDDCCADYASTCLSPTTTVVENTAGASTTTAVENTAAPRSLECFLPRVTGPCRAAIPRWFYNPTSGECEQFTYGGCQGNGNNFITEAECEPACERNDAPPETEEPCPVFCPLIFNPVCGSDGTTYSNPCFLGIENCNRQRDNLVALTSTPGRCPEPECEQPCTKELNPVCGSDGVTYGNPCMFKNAACKFATANQNAAALTSQPGPCPPPEATTGTN